LELDVLTWDVSVTAFVDSLALASGVKTLLGGLGAVHLERLVHTSSAVDGAVLHKILFH
jgi:hypothetical protein